MEATQTQPAGLCRDGAGTLKPHSKNSWGLSRPSTGRVRGSAQGLGARVPVARADGVVPEGEAGKMIAAQLQGLAC